MKKITELARGHWPSILGTLAGLTAEQLTDKHQSCPLCGGKDRYRFDDKDGNGSWFCNKCGGKNHTGGAGNGMDMLMRKTGMEFADAARKIEAHLGIVQDRPQPPTSKAEHTWIYNDIFVVARFSGKRYRPFAFNGNEWKPGVPPGLRPLLNLGKIRATTGTVIICEGEKACDAAARLFPRYTATTWSSGCKAYNKSDFSPLIGRKVVLWPDADEPGQQAMEQLATKLKSLGVKDIRIVTPPPNVNQGWDLADAKWTPEEAFAYLKSNITEPQTTSIPVAEPQPNPDEEEPQPVEVGSQFTYLGYDADGWYFQPHSTGQVTRLTRSAHTSTNLVAIAPLCFWEVFAPGSKTSVDWVRAASMLFEANSEQGVYNPQIIRGRGSWWDNGRTVLHLGDHIIADNKIHPVTENFESRYVYQRLTKLSGYGTCQPLSDSEAFRVLAIAEDFNWEVSASSQLLAGWVVLAPICGALQWRPHIWLTAAAGSGKSAILDRFVSPLLSDMCLLVAGNTTEAGIRQSLKSDALPVVFDEAESNEVADKQRMQNILALARVASSESQATAVKGSATGEATRYHIRSMFMMSSIATHLKQGADRSRFAQLTLKSPNEISKEERQKHWDKLDADLEKYITPDFGKGLIHRTIKLIPVIRESVKVLIRVAADKFNSQRLGDQYGTLLAGAWSLQSSEVITEEQAIMLIDSNDWEPYRETTEIADEQKCIQHILQHQLKIEGEGKSVTRSIGELVEIASLSTSDFDLDTGAAVRALGRHGLKVEPQERCLYVSNTHKALTGILQDTPWVNAWATVLKRLPGAAIGGVQRFTGAGNTTRSVRLSIDTL